MPKVPKVVFDTNVFISAILFGGNPRKILELAREGEIRLFTSSAILLELAEKLYIKFQWSQEEIKDVVLGIGAFTQTVKPQTKIHKITADPDDNRILECAIKAKADFIISGDKHHMLSLKEFEGVKIVSPTEFLEVTGEI